MKKQILVAILLLSLLVPVFPVNAAGGEMQTPIFGGIDFALDDTDTEYDVLSGGAGWTAVESARINVIPSDGVIKDLRIRLSGAPGAGKSYVFTLRLNGAPTTLTATVAGAAATTANDTSHDVTVAAGDYVSLECNPDGIPTVRDAYWSTMFEATVAGESIMLGSSGTVPNDQIRYSTLMGRGTWDDTENDVRTVIPTDGTIKNLYVRLSADPGNAPDGYKFTLRKGGASQSLTVTITADATTGSDTTHDIAVSAGDVVTFMSEPLNGPATQPQAGWGFTFVPDFDGESIHLGCASNVLDQNLDDYMYVVGYTAPSGVESGYYSISQECTISKLYVLLSAAPGAGNSYTFTIREGGTDTGVTTYVSTADTTGNSAIDSDRIGNSEYITLESDPLSVPTAAVLYWGFVVYSGDPTPTNDACDSDAVFSRNQDGWVNVTVSDYLIPDLATVDIQVNTTLDYQNFTLRWDQAADEFSELSDLDNICTLNTTRSIRVNVDTITDQICFCFAITGGADGDCDVRVTTTDDEANIDVDTYAAEFEFSFFNWDEEVSGMVDSAFSFFGILGFMDQAITFINSVGAHFTASLVNLAVLINLQFQVIWQVFFWWVDWATRIITAVLNFGVTLQEILNGVATGTVNIWTYFNFANIIDAVPIFLIIYWIDSMGKRARTQGSLQVLYGDLSAFANVFAYFMGAFSGVIGFIEGKISWLLNALT